MWALSIEGDFVEAMVSSCLGFGGPLAIERLLLALLFYFKVSWVRSWTMVVVTT